jgi:murein DD-endopeptidase MepM/ murein hydrolase activator NlpD
MARPLATRYGLIGLTVLALVTLLTPPAFAQRGESSLRADIRANRARIGAIKKKLDEATRREQELSKQLAETGRRKARAEDELEQAVAKLSEAQDRLRELKMRIKYTSLRLLRAQHALERRLRAIYMEGEVSYMAVLLQSDDFTDFLNQADYLERILKTDAELISSVKSHKATLDEQKSSARSAVIELARLRLKKQDKVESLSRLKAAQDDLYERLERHQSELRGRITEMEHITLKKEKELRELIRRRTVTFPSGVVPPSAGGLIYPVRGPVTSVFGYRIHPITGASRLHSGMDFGVDYGTPIQAADNGLVIESGWVGGYGNTVILDHGGGWTTLYAHASQLNVRAGQTVRRGQTVSFVGSTGMSTGPHLHFELRYMGNPVDPMSRL